MRSRWIAIASLALVSLGAIWLVLLIGRGHGPAARASPVAGRPDETSELDAVQRQVVALRSELARLDQQLTARMPADPASAPPPDPAASELPREERKQAVLAEQRRALALLDAHVRTGPPDPAWTSEIQAELTGSLEAGSGAAVRSIACGATLCRVEMSHADKARLDRFVDTFSASSRRNFLALFERDGDTLATTIFVARAGQQVPNVAKELAGRRDGHSRSTTD
jgi:hypothetical protein